MLGRREAKISKLDSHAMILDKDILRLQVPVVNTNGMAELYSIQDLKENGSGQHVVAKVTSTLGNIGKEITLRAVLEDYEGAIRAVHDLGHRYNIRVAAGPVVELYLALLESPLPWLQPELIQGLDSVWNSGVDVQGTVDDSIGANTKDAGQLQTVSQDLP